MKSAEKRNINYSALPRPHHSLLPVQSADPPPLGWVVVEPEGGVAVARVKVCNGADEERVGRLRGAGLDFRGGSGVSPPAGQGAAGTGEAAAEQEGEEEGGEGRHQDIEPPLSLQLGPAAAETTEEEDVLKPLRLAGLVPSKVHSQPELSRELPIQPVAGEVEEVMVLAGVTVGGGWNVLALKPAALQSGLVVPDVD